MAAQKAVVIAVTRMIAVAPTLEAATAAAMAMSMAMAVAAAAAEVAPHWVAIEMAAAKWRRRWG